MKALSAPVNQKGSNEEFYEARSARFAEIVSKGGVRPLRDIACVTCSLNKEAERGLQRET